MLLRMLPGCLMLAAMLVANGCCCLPGPYCGPQAVGDGCGPAACGPSGCLGSHLSSSLTCGSGCGDVYWGEWTNNPPTCGDPCDSCGNWTGGYGGNYGWHPLQGLYSLWGYRFASAGCDACCHSYGDGMMDGAEEIVPLESDSGDLKVPAVPQPAPEPEAAPTPAPQAARKAVSTRTARQASYRRVPVR